MFKTPEQFAAANKTAVDSLLTVANTALASAERIAALNLNTARSAIEDGAANAKSLLAAKDAQEVVAVQSSLAQPSLEKAVSYSRSVYEIGAQTQEAFAKMLEAQYADFQKQIGSLINEASAKAPAGSEVAVAAVKSAFAAATSAFDNLNKAAKQVVEMAEANVNQATEATVKAVGSAAAAAPAGKKKAA